MLETLTMSSVEESWSNCNYYTLQVGKENGRTTLKIWQYFLKFNIHLLYDHS